MAEILDKMPTEMDLLNQASVPMRDLLLYDDWLPAKYAIPSTTHYAQYLLHCDSKERFSLVSFVWGPGQKTPIHNHTVWGIVGILRGQESSQKYSRTSKGVLRRSGPCRSLEVGQIEILSSETGDIHEVENKSNDIAVSIHLYGGNIGKIRRSIFDRNGNPSPFVSGFNNSDLPNFWTDTADLL